MSARVKQQESSIRQPYVQVQRQVLQIRDCKCLLLRQIINCKTPAFVFAKPFHRPSPPPTILYHSLPRSLPLTGTMSADLSPIATLLEASLDPRQNKQGMHCTCIQT